MFILVINEFPAMFKDVRILAIDELRTHKPAPELAFHSVYFELSMVPPTEWIKIFEKEFPIFAFRQLI